MVTSSILVAFKNWRGVCLFFFPQLKLHFLVLQWFAFAFLMVLQFLVVFGNVFGFENKRSEESLKG
jgi:hypothetical protein